MLKKSLVLFTMISFVSSCNIIPLNLSNISVNNPTQSKGFSIKSTTNLNEIKKVFLPVTRIQKSKNKKEKEDKKSKTFKFNVLNSDLKRDFILNIINGSGGGERVGNLEVKVNGKQIIFNNPEGFEDIDDIHKIKKELCRDDDKKFNTKHDKEQANKNKLDFSIVMQNFFNKKTDSLSARMWGIKEGENILEVNIKDERNNYSLDLSIEGILDSIDIPNAIHSKLYINEHTKSLPIVKGKVNIKFKEGLKVEVIKNSDGTYKAKDINGISLTSLERIIKLYKIKNFFRTIYNINYEELDNIETSVESKTNVESPNLNLFYTINMDENIDVWDFIKELKKLPYIEEAFPNFLKSSPNCTLPNDTYTNSTANNTSQYYWLEKTKISDKFSESYSLSHIPLNEDEFGAWRYGRGNPDFRVAILDAWFEHPDMGKYILNNELIKLHEDFDPTKIEFKDSVGFSKNVDINDRNPRGIYDLFHGTGAAGIIGAKPNNNKGIAGITDAKMVWFRAYQPKLTKNDVYNTEVEENTYFVEPFQYSLWSLMFSEYDDVKVILLEAQVGIDDSPGSGISGSGSLVEDNPFERTLIRILIEKYNKVVIEPSGNYFDTNIKDNASIEKTVYDSSGNSWDTITEKGKRIDIGTIIVGGLHWEPTSTSVPKLAKDVTYYNYGKTDFDNNGIELIKNEHGIDISAPAQNVYTTGSKYQDPGQKNNYFNFGGTSAASPIIAGIAQLMLSVNPDLKPEDIRRYLRLSSQQGSAGITTAGRTTAGMVDAYKAVKLAADGKVQPESCATIVEGSNGLKTLVYNGDKSAYIVGNNTNVPVKTGDKIAIPMTDALLQRLQNIDIRVSSGERLTYYEIVNHYAIYGVPPEMASSSQNVVARDLSTGETLFTFEQALYRAALAMNLNPVTPPDALMLPDSTSYPPFIYDNTSRDVNPGDIVAAALYGLSKNDNVTVTVNGQNMPIYDQKDGYLSFKIQGGLSGTQNVSISTNNQSVTYHDALNILGGVSNNQKIAFIENNILYTINSDGSSLNPLASVTDYFLSWSPDKSKIAYTSNESFTVSAVGGPVLLTHVTHS